MLVGWVWDLKFLLAFLGMGSGAQSLYRGWFVDRGQGFRV